jgi:hypothetical protein
MPAQAAPDSELDPLESTPELPLSVVDPSVVAAVADPLEPPLLSLEPADALALALADALADPDDPSLSLLEAEAEAETVPVSALPVSVSPSSPHATTSARATKRRRAIIGHLAS